MDFDPGKSFFIALVAAFGVLLVYLAITGRYRQVGAALASMGLAPGVGLTLGGALSTSPTGAAGTSDGANVGLGGLGGAGTSAGSTPGRAP